MTGLEESLARYAAAHRDRRNIATHFAGIPLIVFSVVLAGTGIEIPLGPVPASAAALGAIVAGAWWIRFDLRFGLALAGALCAMCAGAGEIVARAGVAPGLAIAGALFVAGWALQFWGHRFEGMKPAFYDDARQLLIGPLFVCAEVFFLFGAKPALRRYIEARVGPVVARRTPSPATQSR